MKINSSRLSLATSIFILIGVVIVSGFLGEYKVQANIASYIHYQGKLNDEKGKPVKDGSYTMTFKIYERQSGGSSIWSSKKSILTHNGVFSALLNVDPDDINFDSESYYLGIEVGSDGEMSPRKRMASVPQAYNANNLRGDGYIKITGDPEGDDIEDATVYINPSDADSSEVILALAVDDSQRFIVYGNGNAELSGDFSVEDIFADNIGIGTVSPTAFLDLSAATTSKASLRVRSGVAPTSPNTGDIYSDGTDLFYYNGSSWDDLTATGSGNASWTDAGTYFYPTGSEFFGNSVSGGSDKIEGIYLGDSASLVFGTDNDITYNFSGSALSVALGSNDINYDSNTLFIDGSANTVGIGTASPTAFLDLPAATTSFASLTINTGTQPTAPSTGDIYSASGNLYYYNGFSWDDLTATGGGSSPWTDAGTYLYPTSSEALGNSASGGLNKITGIYLGDSAPLIIGADNDITYSFSGSELAVTLGSNDINYDSNTLFIDGSANTVGIGTASPTAFLDLPAATSSLASLRIETGSQPSSPNEGDLYTASGNLYFYNGSSWDDLTATGGGSSLWSTYLDGGDFNTRIYPTTASDVILGADDDGTHRIIAGANLYGSLYFHEFGGSGGNFNIDAEGNLNIGSDAGMSVITATGDLTISADSGEILMPTLAAGNGTTMVVGTGAGPEPNGALYELASSVRYKKDVVDIEFDTEKVFDLRPVSFTWKTQGLRDFGLIAEEVYEEIPQMVFFDNEGKPKAVKYNQLSVILLSEMKKQRNQLESLSDTSDEIFQNVKDMEDIIDEINDQMNEIKSMINEQGTVNNIAINEEKIETNKQNIALIYQLLEINDESNSINIAGKLTAKEVESGENQTKRLVIEVSDNAPTIGSAKIEANNKDGSDGKSVIVETEAASDDSEIFITLKQAVDFPLAVTEVKNGKSFKVESKEPFDDDVEFSWWIVGVK